MAASDNIRQWCPECRDYTPSIVLSNSRAICAVCDARGCYDDD